MVRPSGSGRSSTRLGQSAAVMSQKRHPCVRGDRLVVVSAADLAGNDLKFVLKLARGAELGCYVRLVM